MWNLLEDEPFEMILRLSCVAAFLLAGELFPSLVVAHLSSQRTAPREDDSWSGPLQMHVNFMVAETA